MPGALAIVSLRAMSTERKPTDDLREGLGLLFRAAAGAVRVGVREATKDVDIAKAARTAGGFAEQASKEIARIAFLFGQTFEREIAVRPKGEGAQEAEGESVEAEATKEEGSGDDGEGATSEGRAPTEEER